MVALMIVVTIIIFLTVDYGVRLCFTKAEEKKKRRERTEALDIGLRLNFAAEAKSLKRFEVKEPKARILAVDDETIVLDSFRKILVLEGFSLDTVENGPEALTLVQKHDYDFVFTDLKMPEMDGIEVVKAVNLSLLNSPELINLRPYDKGMVCHIAPSNFSAELPSLKIGADAISWYQEEVDRYIQMRPKPSAESGQAAKRAHWSLCYDSFLLAVK